MALKTAIEDQQSKSFSSSVTFFFLQIWRNRLPYSDHQKWKPSSKSTRGTSWTRNIKLLWWWIEYCVHSGLVTQTQLTTVEDANLVIADFGVFKFHLELCDQDVQNSTSQHNDDEEKHISQNCQRRKKLWKWNQDRRTRPLTPITN